MQGGAAAAAAAALAAKSGASPRGTDVPLECEKIDQKVSELQLIFLSLRNRRRRAVADEERLRNKDIPRHNKIITSLAAGAVAGAVAKSTIAPLDRTKIHFQIATDKRYSLRGAVRFLFRTFKNDGFLALWRGNSATMARIVPYAAIQYASHEQWKHILNPTNARNLPPLRRYIAGSLAGVTAASLTYPLDFARARMAITKKCQYNSLLEVFLKIYKTEGLRVVFSGFCPAIVGVIPYAGTSFYTYETLKKWYGDVTGRRDPSHILKLCFGAVAGLLGQSASYPFDIVRRRMQTAGVMEMQHVYTSIWATLVYIYRTEGVRRGLYKGLSMNWIKGPIAVGVSFTTFEFIQRQLRKFEFFHDDRLPGTGTVSAADSAANSSGKDSAVSAREIERARECGVTVREQKLSIINSDSKDRFSSSSSSSLSSSSKV